MSRKKYRRQRELAKLLEGLMMFCLFGAFFGVFSLTKSIIAGGIASGLLLGIFVAIRIYRNILHTKKLKKSGIEDIDAMDGRQFEHYLGHLFEGLGYTVKVTKAAGDYGADLVITKADNRIVVQAKRYSKAVGLKAVQEVQASIAHYCASEGWVITNREFTDEAYSLAKSNNVRLINREQLIRLILEVNPEAAISAKAIRADLPHEDHVCERCGNKMVLRKSAKGEFYGCSSYPKCRNMKAL